MTRHVASVAGRPISVGVLDDRIATLARGAPRAPYPAADTPALRGLSPAWIARGSCRPRRSCSRGPRARVVGERRDRLAAVLARDVTDDVVVAEDEVRSYYDRNHGPLSAPGDADVRLATCSSEAAVRAVDLLERALRLTMRRGELAATSRTRSSVRTSGRSSGRRTDLGWHTARVEESWRSRRCRSARSRAIEAELLALPVVAFDLWLEWPRSALAVTEPGLEHPADPSTASRATGTDPAPGDGTGRGDGGSGKAGRAVVATSSATTCAQRRRGRRPTDPVGRFLRADLTDLGEAIEVAPRRRRRRPPGGDPGTRHPDGRADVRDQHPQHLQRLQRRDAAGARAGRVGLERDGPRPAVRHAPCAQPAGSGGRARPCRRAGLRPDRRAHPRRPHSSYSLSKVVGEEMAGQFARWSRIPFIGLRFSAIREPAEYEAFPDTGATPMRASGTSGATSMLGTSPRRAGSASQPTYPGRRCSSSPRRTRHPTGRTPSCSPNASRPCASIRDRGPRHAARIGKAAPGAGLRARPFLA